MTTSDYIRRVLDGQPQLRTDQFVARKMRSWLRSGAPITAEAVDRVTVEMSRDTGGHRADGGGRVRPSMIGKCVRAQAYSFLGTPVTRQINDTTQSLFLAGTFGHYRWQVAGLSAGFMSDIEVPVSIPEWRVSGQCDAQLSDASIFELKTTNPAAFSKAKSHPREGDVAQLQTYMYALDATHGSLVYECRMTLDFVEWRVERDDDLIDRIRQSCEQVTTATDEQLPPPLAECISHSGAYRWCNYAATCKPELAKTGPLTLEKIKENKK